MNIRKMIMNKIKADGMVKAKDIIALTGFSRAYINRIFMELRDQGKIEMTNRGRSAAYILRDKETMNTIRKSNLKISKSIKNSNVEEDIVLDELKHRTGIFDDISKNILDIVEYAFLEMLNNAIEHSESDRINITIERNEDNIFFTVKDMGVGIFNNIVQKRGYENRMMAVEDLLKGKQTTAPETHSGQGIFFTSKSADLFTIKSSDKKLIFDNCNCDMYLRDIKDISGTRIAFTISLTASRNLKEIFDHYSVEEFAFDKTELKVKLFERDSYVSRSQARRILFGMEEFKIIVLDFEGVSAVGQAFCDEIFRLWQGRNPDKQVSYINANESITFMIERAKA